jgi:hypothetical protein
MEISMFDTISESLNPGVLLVALMSHLAVEGAAKLTLNGFRYLGYLAAVTMLPILMHAIDRHEAVVSERKVRRRLPAKRRSVKF